MSSCFHSKANYHRLNIYIYIYIYIPIARGKERERERERERKTDIYFIENAHQI